MKKSILKQGLKFIYEHREGSITSFSIGFNGGALEEKGYKKGIAHCVEHMVFKGTKNRSEEDINKSLDEIFGFENAMTNYPYVIYYGTCLSSDFERGFELYSDVILNPIFPNKGFDEEIDIICEELKEWKDDVEQYCEDELFFNAFNNMRIKELIIGDEESVRSITLEDIKRFYNEYYCPENAVISVVSSLGYEEVKEVIEKYFGSWNREFKGVYKEEYEYNNKGVFVKIKENIESAKIQYLFPIHELNNREINALRIFNAAFGDGSSSILYDEIRTKNGLAYDISSEIENSRGIKLFTISMATSKKNIHRSINLINNKIENIEDFQGYFTKERIQKLSKRIKLKRNLALEKSIRLSMNLAIYELMYKDCDLLYKGLDNLEDINEKEILEVVGKVFKDPSIQIIQPK